MQLQLQLVQQGRAQHTGIRAGSSARRSDVCACGGGSCRLAKASGQVFRAGKGETDAGSHVQAVVAENGNEAVRLAVRRHQVVSSPLDVVQSCNPIADAAWQRNTMR